MIKTLSLGYVLTNALFRRKSCQIWCYSMSSKIQNFGFPQKHDSPSRDSNSEKVNGYEVWEDILYFLEWFKCHPDNKQNLNRITKDNVHVISHVIFATLKRCSYLSKDSMTRHAASMTRSSLPSNPLKRYILPLTSTTKRSCLGSCCSDPGWKMKVQNKNELVKRIVSAWKIGNA